MANKTLTMKPRADKPHRLDQIFQNYNPPLYFVTFCTAHRKPILANDETHGKFRHFAIKAEPKGVAIGRYVIMPDHIHFFLRMAPEHTLGTTVRLLKRSLSSSIAEPLPHWQPGFFDHLLRHGESYSQKWDYVKNNPVRAGFVEHSNDWKYQGEMVSIRY